MGSCLGTTPQPSKPEREEDKRLDKELKAEREADAEVKKLLLLGAGGSGKSTLFKQLQSIHGSGFSERDRRQYRSQIHEQMIESMKTMLTKGEEYIEEYEEQLQSNTDENNNEDEYKHMIIENINKYRILEANESAVEIILSARSNNEMRPKFVKALQQLWNDPAIQYMYNERHKICVADSTAYFMDNISDISLPEYLPTDEDLMLVRYRTTGMAEKKLRIEDHMFNICDVGGQRNERRKWIHFFDNVTAVIFVASLSAYDEVTFEDETTNSMLESVSVFNDTLKQESFMDTAFILFLNKNDLFVEKIGRVSLSVCWQNYDGEDGDYNYALDFISECFESQNAYPEKREIYTHITQATDTDNVEKVFHDVQHVVVDWSLQRAGLY